MQIAIVIIVIVLVAAIVASFIGIIFEDNSIRNFSGYFYKYGFLVYKKIIPVSNFNILPDEKHVISKGEGVFHFTDEGVIYFRSNETKFRFDMRRLRTPFSFKARGIIRDINFIEITARLYLFSSILLVSWTLLGVVLILLAGVSALFFGLAFLVIFFISYPVEKNRMEKMVGELKDILGAFNRET
jgi:hypothetical protein